MHALIINCSCSPYYNLSMCKLHNRLAGQGHNVHYYDGDPRLFAYGYNLVAFSVIFLGTLLARDIALQIKDNCEIWCGGPGMAVLSNWWKQEIRLDWRFERQRDQYGMTFANRGCPVSCYFCIVPRIEGTGFTLDPDFEPVLPSYGLRFTLLRFQPSLL